MNWDELIRDRIMKTENLEARRLLRQILQDPFAEIVKDQEKRYQNLEDQVIQEIPANPLEKFSIDTGLCAKADFVQNKGRFFPMAPEDLEPVTYNEAAIIEKTGAGQSMKIATVFFESDSETLREIIDSDQRYRAVITTDKTEHLVSISLLPSDKYTKIISRLYQVFAFNKLAWQTVNCPYAYKFLDVMLKGSPAITVEEKIIRVSFDFGPHRQYYRPDMLPVWNVETIGVQSRFCTPADQPKFFTCEIPVHKEGLEHGYLVDLDNKNTESIHRQNNQLSVITAEEKPKLWKIKKFWQGERPQPPWLISAAFTNRQRDSIASRFARLSPMPIRTGGEVQRIVSSFVAGAPFTLLRIITKPPENRQWTIGDLNSFIADELRSAAGKEIMLLQFRSDKPPTFTTNEELSFLVSAIQMRFPEYRCVGELVQ